MFDICTHAEISASADAEATPCDSVLETAARIVLRHLPKAGRWQSPVQGMALYRIESNSEIERFAGGLMSTFIIRGRKATTIGNRKLEYGAGESLVCGIASPSEFHTLEASAENPFLAMSVSLDLSMLMQYAGSLANGSVRTCPQDGIFVIRPDMDLALAFLGLLRLLERPELLDLRAPLLLGELHILLLDSPCGQALRSLASAGSENHAVLQIASWIRNHYSENVSVEALAERSHMSSASFHRRFLRLTGYSPVQFRKRVRLYEARRLLLSKRLNVTSAAFEVGYESPSQFVRDYKKFFGETPLRNVRSLTSSE